MQDHRLHAGHTNKKPNEFYLGLGKGVAAGTQPEGASAALMETQLRPKERGSVAQLATTVRSLVPTDRAASKAASVSLDGGPDGDAVQAHERRAAAVIESAAAAVQHIPKGASASLMGTQLHPRDPVSKFAKSTTRAVSEKQDAREFAKSEIGAVSEKQDVREFQNSRLEVVAVSRKSDARDFLHKAMQRKKARRRQTTKDTRGRDADDFGKWG